MVKLAASSYICCECKFVDYLPSNAPKKNPWYTALMPVRGLTYSFEVCFELSSAHANLIVQALSLLVQLLRNIQQDPVDLH